MHECGVSALWDNYIKLVEASYSEQNNLEDMGYFRIVVVVVVVVVIIIIIIIIIIITINLKFTL
jgi:uncharacterized protein (DUF983 family)